MDSLGVIAEYSRNDMRALKNLVYPIFIKFGLPMSEYDDFLSIANMTLWQCSQRFDDSMNDNFKLFLRGCLQNKFKNELTRRNRQRRVPTNMTISLDSVVNEDGNTTLLDFIIADDSTEDKTEYSDRALQYISSLSEIQKNILDCMINGYNTTEIAEHLHISSKDIADNLQTMRAYENIKILLAE